MATVGEEHRGPNTNDSYEDVIVALDRAIDSSPFGAVQLKNVVEKSDFSRATVNKRLGEIIDSGGYESAEFNGGTYYWNEQRGLATSGGFNTEMVREFLFENTPGEPGENFEHPIVAMWIIIIIGILLSTVVWFLLGFSLIGIILLLLNALVWFVVGGIANQTRQAQLLQD